MVEVKDPTARIDFNPKTGEVTKITHYHRVAYPPELCLALAKFALDGLESRDKAAKLGK